MMEVYKYNETESNKENIPIEALTIDIETLEELKKRVNSDQSLQVSIAKDDEEIKMQKKHWAEYSDREWSGKDRISLSDFLKSQGLVEKNKLNTKKVWNKRWNESLRWSNDAEKQFLSSTTNIVQGKFVEVLQISLINDNQVIGKGVAVGSGLEVTQENIDSVIEGLNISSVYPKIVYIVHNHYDEYAELTLPEDEEAKDGFATTGGLSKQDIEFADKLWAENLKEKSRVVMVVINERGLTFSYEAGTSESRDWKKDF